MIKGNVNQEGKQKTVIKQIYDFLKQNNVDVYMPGEHKGDCLKPYVVVKNGGVYNLLNVSSERPIYIFMFYVPFREYLKLEEYKESIKQMLKELYPMIQYSGNETDSAYDESNKSFTVSVDYYGIRKISYIL